MEPYMTNRVRGSGLGLAITGKIVSDHGGSVGLTDAPLGGARVQLVFPRSIVTKMTEQMTGEKR
jgi:two-component system, NtrC family, nitrogen regulation sensor histidine kinase NtrY